MKDHFSKEKEALNKVFNDSLPMFKQFEKERLVQQRLWYLNGALIVLASLIPVILMLYISYCVSGPHQHIYTCLPLLMLAPIMFFINHFVKSFRKTYMWEKKVKNYFIYKISKIFGVKEWRKCKEKEEENLLRILIESGIQEFTSTKDGRIHLVNGVDEYIYGEYSGVCYRIWDMKTCILIAFPCNKPFKHKTSIYTKDIVNDLILFEIILSIMMLAGIIAGIYHFDAEVIFNCLFCGIGAILMLFLTLYNIKLKKTTLEDPIFGSKYKVFSKDQVEARYLITPSFMERFKEMEKMLKTKRIQCVFFKGYVFFGITSKTNRFELATLHVKADSPEQFNKFFDEFTTILNMIDYFKLNENTKL